MHRCKNRGFCCGAGAARMWMEERIGKRINTERIDEALELNPDTISTACPYCLVMLGDAVAAKKGSGEAKDSLEVIDVAQLLVRSVALKAASPSGASADDAQAGEGSGGSAAAPRRPAHCVIRLSRTDGGARARRTKRAPQVRRRRLGRRDPGTARPVRSRRAVRPGGGGSHS